MEIQHTAYRQIRSVFGILSTQNTRQYLGLMESQKNGIIRNKYGIISSFRVIRLRVNRNPTRSKSSKKFSIWDFIDPKHWSGKFLF